MKDPVLEIASGASESQSSSPSASDRGNLEKRIGERMEVRLEEIKKGVADGLNRMQEKMVPVIDERIRKVLSGSFAALTNTTKEALTQVVQAILFDSGILERLVSRIVDEKLPGKVEGAAGGLGDAAKKETLALIQKELSAALASEQMKMIIDDKFRAISIYLKSDVIPKAVQDALKPKASSAPAAGAAPAAAKPR